MIKLNGCIFSFSIKDDDLLRKYNTIWDKGSTYIKTEFDSKSFYKKTVGNQINLLVMRLQIFMIKKFIRWLLITCL